MDGRKTTFRPQKQPYMRMDSRKKRSVLKTGPKRGWMAENQGSVLKTGPKRGWMEENQGSVLKKSLI